MSQKRTQDLETCHNELLLPYKDIIMVKEAVTQNSANPSVVLTTEAPNPPPPFGCTYWRFSYRFSVF